MILVTGATGQFGSKVVEYLLKKETQPSEIAVLVRDKEKARQFEEQGIKVNVGDYLNEESLLKAMQGVDKLLLVSGNDKKAYSNRTTQHLSVIRAAKMAGIKHIVYTSFIRNPGFERSSISAFQQSHLDTEDFLKDSGITYTILQNGIYFEMIPVFVGADVAEKATILFPAANGSASYVLREELAEAAAYVLTSQGHDNKIYPLTNNESVNFREIANSIGKAIEKEVNYISPSPSEFEAILSQAGVPEMYITALTMWASAHEQGALYLKNNTLEEFLSRKPTSLQQFIDRVYQK